MKGFGIEFLLEGIDREKRLESIFQGLI